MAIAFARILGANYDQTSASQIVITVADDMAAGESVLVQTKGSGGVEVTGVTDSNGHSYTLDEAYSLGAATCSLWSSLNVASPLEIGDTITVTFGSGGTNYAAQAVSFSGLAGTRDQTGEFGNASLGTAGSCSTPEISSAAQLIAGGFSTGAASGAWSSSAGWTDVDYTGSGERIHFFYRIVSVVETPSVTFTWANNSNYTAVLRSYPAAGGTEYTKTLTESLSLTDSNVSGPARTLTETMDVFDATIKDLGRAVADAFAITDGTLTKGVGRQLPTETAIATDSIVRDLGRALTETLSTSDTITRLLTRALAETLTATDALDATIVVATVYYKTLTETLTATDNLGRQKALILSILLARDILDAALVRDVLDADLTRDVLDLLGGNS